MERSLENAIRKLAARLNIQVLIFSSAASAQEEALRMRRGHEIPSAAAIDKGLIFFAVPATRLSTVFPSQSGFIARQQRMKQKSLNVAQRSIRTWK